MLKLSAPVGATPGNKPVDVAAVQRQLNILLECMQGYQRIPEDGRIGPKTVGAIRTFQRAIAEPKIDGIVRPGSQALKTLSQPLIRLQNPNAACQVSQQDRVRGTLIRRLNIVERKVWGAMTATKPYTSDWGFTGIAVHHAGNSYSCSADPVAEMRRIQRTEIGQGFEDVGYHFGVSCTGTIYEGRDIRYRGEHVLNQNAGLLGIVLLADFTASGEGAKFGKNETFVGRMRDRLDFSNETSVPTPQKSSLETLIVTLAEYFNIKRLGGHREYAATLSDERSCPGDLVISHLNGLRQKHGLVAP